MPDMNKVAPAVGPAALLSVAEAAEWLGMPLEAATTWLREHGLVRTLQVGAGRTADVYERVSVREVLDALAAADKPAAAEWISTSDAASALGIDRCTLDAMVQRAPKDLPGAPVHVGEGRLRKHYRWNAELLQEWARAYRDWNLTRSRRGVRR